MPVRFVLLLLSFLLFFGPATAAERSGTVSWVYDGDTLRVEKIGKVRLLGIDTPESSDSSRDRYYLDRFAIPRNRLRLIARQAKQFNIRQVKGRPVRLRWETEQHDKYGRLLAYLYLPDGRMLNRLLLEKGLATVFRRYSFTHKKDFLAAESAARKQGLGFWQ